MKKFKLLIPLLITLLYLIGTSINANETKWSLQITKPDFEMTHHKLTAKVFRPYLKKTGWRCQVERPKRNNQVESRRISCNFSIKKTGRIYSILSCSKDRPYQELILELLDERKDLTFKLMLTCQYQRSE